MKKVFIVLAVVSLLLAFILIFGYLKFIETNSTVVKTLTPDRDCIAEMIRIGKNGDYVISGEVLKPTSPSGFASIGSFVLKLNSSLNVEWAKFVPYDDVWAIPLSDGGVAIFTRESLTKLDSEGKILWSKKYSFRESASFYRSFSFATKNVIIETKDKGFAIIGNGIIKLDSLGNVEWAKEYSGQGTYHPFSIIGSAIIELENGNYVGALWIADEPIEGGSGAVWGCCNDFLIIEADPKGNLIFSRWIGCKSTNEVPNSIIVNSDGSFVVSGYGIITYPDSADFSTDLPLVVLDKNGIVLSVKNFVVHTGDDYFLSKTPDGYIASGQGIVKFDSNLNIKWAKKSDEMSFSYIDTDGYTFVSVGNLPGYLSSADKENRIFVAKGAVRQVNLQQFKKFDVKAEYINPDVNKLLNLHVEDITSKISVTSIKVEFENIEIK